MTMLFGVLWNFMTGYVIIQVEGLSLERFLNTASSNGIKLWRVRRGKYTLLHACVSLRGYKRIEKIFKDGRYLISVVKKGGLPFILLDLKKRLALAIGLIMLIAVVFTLSAFVWKIELTGAERLNSTDIISEIHSLGIKEGVLKNAVDLKAAEKHLLKKYPEIAWINAKFTGVMLGFEIVEAYPVPEIPEEEGIADIIAAKDAYVKKILVFEGRAVVKEGETVRKGQKLIEGEIWEEGRPRMSFFARGSVKGRIWYSGRADTRLYNTVNVKTGAYADLRYIQIGNNLVLIGGEEPAFKKYESETKVKYALGENLFLPVKILDIRQTEVFEEKVYRLYGEAKAEAEEKAHFLALSKVPDDALIIGFDTRFDIIDDNIFAICYIETEEEIGVTKKLKGNAG